MTGYGKAVAEYNGKTYTIEVKSLNSKFLDLSLRLPNGLKEQEMEVRTEIGKLLERGKIDLSINTDNGLQKSVGVKNSNRPQQNRVSSRAYSSASRNRA